MTTDEYVEYVEKTLGDYFRRWRDLQAEMQEIEQIITDNVLDMQQTMTVGDVRAMMSRRCMRALPAPLAHTLPAFTLAAKSHAFHGEPVLATFHLNSCNLI